MALNHEDTGCPRSQCGRGKLWKELVPRSLGPAKPEAGGHAGVLHVLLLRMGIGGRGSPDNSSSQPPATLAP